MNSNGQYYSECKATAQMSIELIFNGVAYRSTREIVSSYSGFYSNCSNLIEKNVGRFDLVEISSEAGYSMSISGDNGGLGSGKQPLFPFLPPTKLSYYAGGLYEATCAIRVVDETSPSSLL